MTNIRTKEQIIQDEILKCRKDFIYFSEKYLKILDKNDNIKSLELNYAQSTIHRHIEGGENFLKILKGRQFGSTTYIAARYFWEALLNPNIRVAVIAHTDTAVKNIFGIYQRFYDNLPNFLKIKTNKASASTLEFATGSIIKVGTANSENFRGSTFSRIHASEAAFWDSMGTTIQSIFQSATNNPTIIVETTPNGLNEFYTFWKDNNGYYPLFLSWLEHEEYKLNKLPKDGDKPTQLEMEFIKEAKLTPEQGNWFIRTLRTRCNNNLNTFKTEYPASEIDAFIATGAFVFPKFARFGTNKPSERGWIIHQIPQKYRVYTMGVDVASGSPNGDYTAITVLDVTDNEKPLICATYYDKVTSKELMEVVKRAILKWDALICVERNNYGLILIEELTSTGYPYLYREVKYDKFKNQFTDNIGFYTSAQTRPLLIARLTEYINGEKIKIADARLLYELSNFIYSVKGRAEAEKHFHDDLIMSFALALVAIDQVNDVADEIKKAKKPTTVEEVILFESSTGVPISQLPEDYFLEQSDPETWISPADW